MKRILLICFPITLFFCCIFSQKIYSQEILYTTPNQFYYNSFDNGNLGVFNNYLLSGSANQTITTASTTTTTFNGTTALTSVPGVNSKNNIYGQILPTSDRDLNNNEFEWTFLYKNNSNTSPIEPYDNGQRSGPVSAEQAAWQYWLTATDKDQTSSGINGFYMTQVGTNMILRYRVNQYDIQSLITFPITNNALWTIKIQRIYTSGSCAWRIWANPVVGNNYEATQPVGNNSQAAFNNYSYSILAVTDLRSTGNNFYFDNIKLYTRRLSFTALNTAANGITQPSYYPSQPNVALYGLKVYTRGTFNFNSINLGLTSSTGTNVNAFFGNARIIRSTDDVYTTPLDNTTLATFTPQSIPIQSGTFSTIDNTSSSGNADGSLTNVSNYFLVVDMLSATVDPKFNYGNAGPYTTFTFTGPTKVTTTENNNNPPNSSFTNNAATGNNNITFTPTAPPSAPTVGPVSPLCGAGIATLKASGGTPSGGTYDWYAAPSGGVPLQSSTSDTYKPFVGGTTIFYVAYTANSSTSARTAVTVTVTPKVSSSITAPVLSWPFNNDSNDITGNANHGLRQNAPTLINDRNGVANSAYNFNGSNTYIVAKNGFSPTQLAFSVSIWFKTTIAGGMLVGFGGDQISASNAVHDRHIYMSSTGQLYFGVYDGSPETVNTGTATFADGLWHHAVATCGPTGGLKLYVDGVLRSAPLGYTTPQNLGGFWRIGGDNLGGWPNSFNNYFNGVLDDFVVYNHELTPAEAVDNDMNLYTFASSYCANNPLVIGAPAIAGANYSWVDNSNSANTSNTNPANFPSATKSSYTLTVTISGCSPSVSTVTPITPTFTWTGAGNSTSETLNTNWINTTTGVANVAPSFSGTESLVVPVVTAGVYPVLSGNRSIYSLTIANGASLSLNGQTLNIGCNIINNNTAASGILYGPATTGNTSSEITWGGSLLSQNYLGVTTTVPMQTGKMTVNNTSTGTVTIQSGSVNIYNLLTMTKGKLAVTAAAKLTLKSTSNLTASVPALGAGTSITGNVTVERYFTGGNPANRGWRLMGSPVNNSGNVPVSAADTYNFSSLKDNMFVVSPGGASKGFDPGTGYTILFYDTPSKLFTWPTDITSPRSVGAGFYYFFRGNRTDVNGNKLVNNGAGYATPEPDVVGLQTGTLNQQSFSYTLANDNGGDNWNQLGNPYASSILMPSAGGSGSGTPYTNTTGFIYTYTPKATSVTVAPNPVIIASGQGFFVKKVTGSSVGSVNFSESLKVTGQPANLSLLLGLPVATTPPLISLKMVQDSTNYDIAYLRFLDSYKKEYDEMEDADHLNGSGQTVFLGAMTTDNHLVALASQPLEKQKTSVFLNVNDSKSGLYSIEKIDINGIPPAYDVWLMDHFKKDSLDIRANSTYKFNLDKNNAETYGATRFEVVIKKKSLPPYQLISFMGKKSGADVLLNWNTLNEYDYTSFELQKSKDGINFDAVRNIQSTSSGSYSFKDIYNNAGDKDVYYRLKQTDIYDHVTYSSIIIVSIQSDGAALSIFPNPASNIIQYTLKTDIKSGVRLRIFNTMGVLMKNSIFTTSSGQQDISSLIPGNYTIELTDINSKKIILISKFIKI